MKTTNRVPCEMVEVIKMEMSLYRAAMVGGFFGAREMVGYKALLDTMHVFGISIDSVL